GKFSSTPRPGTCSSRRSASTTTSISTRRWLSFRPEVENGAAGEGRDMDAKGDNLSERELRESNLWITGARCAFCRCSWRRASQGSSFVISFVLDCCVNFRLAY